MADKCKSMDILKKERSQLRTSFTKAQRKLEELLSHKDEHKKSNDEAEAQLDLMRMRLEAIAEKDDAISTLLYAEEADDSVLEEEQEKVDHYQLQYFQAQKRVERERIDPEQSSSNGSVVSSVSTMKTQKYKLPVLKLKEFDGDLKNWMPFWGQFEKIHKDNSLEDIDKLGYLTMSMVPDTAGYKLVESFPATKEMYAQVIAALQARFGRSDLLTEYYIREVLKLIIDQNKDKQLCIVALYDKLQSHLRNLEALGVSSQNYAPILLPLVLSCIPEYLLQLWERSTNHKNSSVESLENLLQFLKIEVESAQKLDLAKKGFGVSTNSNNISPKAKDRRADNEPRYPTAAALVNTFPNTSCLFCARHHKSADCEHAKKLSMQERRDKVNMQRACYTCLETGHRAIQCNRQVKCMVCSGKHYAIMCSGIVRSSVPEHGHVENVTLTTVAVSCNTAMQTLIVNLIGKDNRVKPVRVLIDTGSQRSYVSEKVAKDMGYVPIDQEAVQHVLFGGGKTNVVHHNLYHINVAALDLTFKCNFKALSQDVICGSVSSVPDGPWVSELARQNIRLSDMNAGTDIDILVGSDIAGKLWTGKRVILSSGLVAMETLLGWTLCGKVPSVTSRQNSVATVVTDLFVRDASVADLWSLDVLGITDPAGKVSQAEIDKETEEHFLSTVQVNDEGRYEIRLPFVKNHPPLSSNYASAIKRLENLNKKLKQDGYFDSYQAVLDDWVSKGIVEEVPEEDLDKFSHYLPHRHVVKPNSTTPVRPVFDASAKEHDKVSLNQCLETGPNLIDKIPACLARFRKNQYGVSGDIEKAFLQISINGKDRDYLRFLWQEKDGRLKVFRHCRVVFGVSSSPFLLESCIKLHLQTILTQCKVNESPYSSDFIELLEESFYVDNCLTSLETLKDVEEFRHVASSVMNEKMFKLRGWEFSGEKSSTPTNVLGLLWNKEKDTLAINNESLLTMDLKKITKKVMLSAAHRVFDPIGMVSGFTLLPKLLIQQTWEKGLTWTEEVDESMKEKFMQWMSEVPLLSKLQIPRWAMCLKSIEKMSLHVFSDASALAYAAVVFIRIEHENDVTIQLLASRARVAPSTKTKDGMAMSIPRLELLAASIATRLCKTVVEDFKLFGIKITFWTDASTVLAWILKNEPWNVFVMNRIKEIRSLSDGCEWRHVPGELNPADLPSRGSSLKKIIQLKWWEGPSWLRGSPTHWPLPETNFNEEEVNKEKKKTVVSSTLSSTIVNTTADWYYTKFSQFKKVVRTIGWMMRFKHNTLKKDDQKCGELTAEEYSAAEKKVLMLVQKETFSDTSHPKLTTLMPFVDESGLIRLKTKVLNLPDADDFSQPIVLPNADHPVVRRLIVDVHNSNCHAGTQILMSILRKQYWILGGRRTIRAVLSSCVVCKRFLSKRMEVAPNPLPEARVNNAKIFEVTGVDLAGPLRIKSDNNGTKKVWVCLFTCAVYRAVRLELVSNISTDSFIQALKRFCSKQGRPRVIYSDNGTNFVGFDSASDRLDWDAIACYSSAIKIDWRFNPPSAPWWGGFWERLIGILKSLLRRVLGRSFVNYETMTTILCDCESVINSRPLTYMSDDVNELAVLTPAMFLHELEETNVPEFDLIETSNLQQQFKYRRDLKKQLQERFKLEYLGQLQLFSCKKKEHTVRVGDVVLIGDDNMKRIDWPYGRIVELIPGKDRKVRVVQVLTKSGVLTRPIQRLYPLETFKCPCPETAQDCLEPDNASDKGQILPSHESHQPLTDDNNQTLTAPKSGQLPEDIDIVSEDVVNGGTRLKDNVPLLTRRGRCVRKPSRFD